MSSRAGIGSASGVGVGWRIETRRETGRAELQASCWEIGDGIRESSWWQPARCRGVGGVGGVALVRVRTRGRCMGRTIAGNRGAS
jgi:hypothetical protein